jgi:hypothetical protein
MSGYPTITVVSGNLFDIAARYLGDATQAVRIAQLNGLRDFFITAQSTLLIPPVNSSAAGGVPQQT